MPTLFIVIHIAGAVAVAVPRSIDLFLPRLFDPNRTDSARPPLSSSISSVPFHFPSNVRASRFDTSVGSGSGIAGPLFPFHPISLCLPSARLLHRPHNHICSNRRTGAMFERSRRCSPTRGQAEGLRMDCGRRDKSIRCPFGVLLIESNNYVDVTIGGLGFSARLRRLTLHRGARRAPVDHACEAIKTPAPGERGKQTGIGNNGSRRR
jgi:hypothetical protein